MKIETFFSYFGKIEPRKAPYALTRKLEPFCYLGMTGEYRCACSGDNEPLGELYTGSQSNPEWIAKLSMP